MLLCTKRSSSLFRFWGHRDKLSKWEDCNPLPAYSHLEKIWALRQHLYLDFCGLRFCEWCSWWQRRRWARCRSVVQLQVGWVDWDPCIWCRSQVSSLWLFCAWLHPTWSAACLIRQWKTRFYQEIHTNPRVTCRSGRPSALPHLTAL